MEPKSLQSEGDGIYSLLVINNGDTTMIASGNENGYVKLWNLKTHDCMGIFKTCSRTIWGLQVIRDDCGVCLVCQGDANTIKVWDL